MTRIDVNVELPDKIGDYSGLLARLRTRKQIALINAIKDKQATGQFSEDVQLRFGSRRINVRQQVDTARLVRRYGEKVFGQRWIAISTEQPPLDRVVNFIMQSVFVRSPFSLQEKSRTSRYRNSWRLYQRQAGKRQLQNASFPIGKTGWDNDTMFVVANLISYASSLEAHRFALNSQGIMFQAAKDAQRKFPFVGIRFRYYQENRLPSGDYRSANADLSELRYYAVPVIEIGRASLVRKPNRRPGVNARSTRAARDRRQRQAARRNFARNRRR